MSSSKKKPLLVNCPTCDVILLTKDTARHADCCGKPINNLEISGIKNNVLRGFNTSLDKATSFLPPDAIGWEKEHSVLMNSQTMESFDILARQPVRITYGDESTMIGVVWPCKEIALLKSHVVSSRVPRERLITIEKIEKIEKVKNFGVRVDANVAITPSIREFIEIYLSHSFIQYGTAISMKYLGQELKVTPEESFQQKMNNMSLDNHQVKPILSPLPGYSLQVLNSEGMSNEQPCEVSLFDSQEVGGMFGTKKDFENYILEPIRRNELPCSILLHGLPGSGKTFILKKLASILGSSCVFISNLDELSTLGVVSGNSNCRIFIIDINEMDKENGKANKSLDTLLQNENSCVILSVRSSDSLDLGYRVRFPIETEITVPTQDERIDILKKIIGNYGLDAGHDVDIAKFTHGFTAGDLCSLLQAAKFANAEGTVDKIEIARKRIRPTGIRQFILEVPTVSWNDIGGNEELKLEIQQAVIWPQKHPEAFERFGIDPPAGILLYGPPGCSKTLIARALANEAKMNFLAVKGPELFSKWVGDSEKAIRDLFARARQVAPTIVFFDEIDAVGSSRGSEKSSGVSDRVLAQLLAELDGLEKMSRVILLAATNRPDQLDSALLRPGRLDRAIYVGLPCEATRRAILEMRTKKMKFENVDQTLELLVQRTAGYSGAEIVAVTRTAAMYAMRENISANEVQWKHFEQALVAVVSRTEAYLLEIYDDFKTGRTSND